MFFCTVLLVLFHNIFHSNGARILAMVPTPSYSHQVVFQPIWKELSLRGHQVTTITTNPINDPSLTNLTEIDLHHMYDVFKHVKSKMVEDIIKHQWKIFLQRYRYVINVTDTELHDPAVQNLIKNENQTFDLIMVEYRTPILLAFGERFKCPIIAVMSMDAFNQLHNQMGNPTHPILYPTIGSPFVGKLNLRERILTTMFNFLMNGIYQFTKSEMQSVVSKHFGKSTSNLDQLIERIDMVFVNTDPILHPVRPLVPAVIQIGAGIHLKPPKPLPNNIQKYLDSAAEGAIYFSLGSSAQSKNLKEDILTIIKQSLSKLPYKVLWKFEGHLAGKPDNVMITKWAPQQDVLRHPNIKLFISQCGLQSTEEALHNGVPILGIPLFDDQPANAKLIVMKGMGLSVNHDTITEEEFSSKILELIQNPKYRQQVEKVSNMAKDQPMTGLEKAVWWTEYVLRHKGAKHLRGPAVEIPAYQYYLLDVIGFLSLLIVIILYVFYKIICLLCKLTCLFKNSNKVKTT